MRGADGTDLRMGGYQERSSRTSPPIEDRGSGAAGSGVYGDHGVVIGALGGALVGGQAPGFVVAVVAFGARFPICRRQRLAPLCWLVLALTACSPFGSNGPPYVVFFQERSAQLDDHARSLIAVVAKRANDQPAAPVDIIGYTDSAGSPPADVLLSQQRAQAVADALTASGVAANRLVRTGRGQTGDDPGIASRRVEITIGGV
jgi:hypothetical protein